jgi:hypothetical protein
MGYRSAAPHPLKVEYGLLTIGDTGFIDRGGMVGLVTENNRVVMEFNVESARQAGLRIPAQVLALGGLGGGARSGGRAARLHDGQMPHRVFDLGSHEVGAPLRSQELERGVQAVVKLVAVIDLFGHPPRRYGNQRAAQHPEQQQRPGGRLELPEPLQVKDVRL